MTALVHAYDRDLDAHIYTGALAGPAGFATLHLQQGRVALDTDFVETDSVLRIEAADASFAPDALDDPNVAGRAGRLALALAEHHAERRSMRVRAVAALEAANLAVQLRPDLDITVDPEPLWSFAATHWPDHETDPVLREALALAVQYAQGRNDVLARRLDQLGTAWPMAAAAFEMETMAQPTMARAPAPAPAMKVRAGRREVAGPEFTVEIDPELDVTILNASLADGIVRVGATGPGDLYLRVFRRERHPVPLAIVPFTGTRFDGATTVAIVPRAARADGLIVEITDAPETPCLPPRMRAAQRATRLGQDAARLRRRGDDATDAWSRCATEWDRAGDASRAARAREYARSRGENPLLSDLVD